MSAAPAPHHRQPLVTLWLVQLVGTMVLAAIVVWFYRTNGPLFKSDPQWSFYALYGIVLAIAPAMMYLRRFREWMREDEQSAQKHGGQPNPAIRKGLQTSLALGSALCELPQAVGVAHLMLGGEMRWFLGSTLITIALRLSYRPFDKKNG